MAEDAFENDISEIKRNTPSRIIKMPDGALPARLTLVMTSTQTKKDAPSEDGASGCSVEHYPSQIELTGMPSTFLLL